MDAEEADPAGESWCKQRLERNFTRVVAVLRLESLVQPILGDCSVGRVTTVGGTTSSAVIDVNSDRRLELVMPQL